MEALKAAIGDGVITFLWMFCISTVGPTTAVIARHLELRSLPLILGITVLLITALLLIFSQISKLLGKASFNPANTAAFYAAGVSKDSLFSMALRFPAQALGSVGGVLAIREVMPSQYKSLLKGPSLKVDLHTGAVAEFIITFVFTSALLWIIIKGPSNAFLKTLMLATTTVTMVVSGRIYTGPSMNPVNNMLAMAGLVKEGKLEVAI
ncbi:uncharacterized protein A4U43_C04F13930 [Asparagus officinalis]|uniref:Aquaporin n=1 Tax=Asparagus officinalis TaxID=4686 RepID=A0A5P1F0P2_ASPOF|nr:uncharacterized protein A4U43_C04F13930 [Asparagus officinalis]